MDRCILDHQLHSSFNGYIDNLKVTTRAKSASEILADATMVVYFSFDGSSLAQDMGPNEMNGTVSNANAVTGRVGQGLAFSGAASSYLQIYGFYQLGQSNKPFSFSLWIYPYSITGGTLIQKSTIFKFKWLVLQFHGYQLFRSNFNGCLQ